MPIGISLSSSFSFFLFMTRNRDKEPFLTPNPESEKTLRKRLQLAKAQHSGGDLLESFEQETEDMAEPQEETREVLGDFTMPTSDFYGKSIAVPAIGANNFELKP